MLSRSVIGANWGLLTCNILVLVAPHSGAAHHPHHLALSNLAVLLLDLITMVSRPHADPGASTGTWAENSGAKWVAPNPVKPGLARKARPKNSGCGCCRGCCRMP